MTVSQIINAPWARKHDMPGTPLIPKAPVIMFPHGLQDVIDICTTQGAGRKAAGSHWALSTAAVSDDLFVETHDPNEKFPAMGRTLFDVVPACLTTNFLQSLAAQTPPPYDANHVVGADSTAGPDVTVVPELAPGTYFVHCETGKRIFQLYAELDIGDDTNPQSLAVLLKTKFGNAGYLGPWALETAGGAGGQTIFGALATGTHGGDFGLPPMADAVEAMHLVTDGGAHFWIERSPNPNRPLQLQTDQTALQKLFAVLNAPSFQVVHDDDTFNSVLVAAGRFGIVYSVVLRVVRQYSLHVDRTLTTWEAIKGQIADPNSALFQQPAIGSSGQTPPPCKFLQIAPCVTPQQNFGAHLCGVTKMWNGPLAKSQDFPDPLGRPERRGDIINPNDPTIGGPLFSKAGNSHPLNPTANAGSIGQATFLNIACSDASFSAGIVNEIDQAIQNFAANSAAPAGGTIATIAAVDPAVASTLLALVPFLLALLPFLAAFVAALQAAGASGPTTLGQALSDLANGLLSSSNPQARAAGLFVWQGIANALFSSQQGNMSFSAISYAAHDGWDYLDHSCNVDVNSIEVFFDASDPKLITFVDALLVFEVEQEKFLGRAFAGYISLQFMGKTGALLGMQRFDRTCSVEVSGLKAVSGTEPLINFALTLALNPNFRVNGGGILHWGQRNTATQTDIEFAFGDAIGQPSGPLHTWRAKLSQLTEGRLNGFSSEFTRQTGLEIVTPQISNFGLNTPVVASGPIVLEWDFTQNPPAPRTTGEITWTSPGGLPGSLQVALSGKEAIVQSAVKGVYQFTLTVTLSLNNMARTTSLKVTVNVA